MYCAVSLGSCRPLTVEDLQCTQSTYVGTAEKPGARADAMGFP